MTSSSVAVWAALASIAIYLFGICWLPIYLFVLHGVLLRYLPKAFGYDPVRMQDISTENTRNTDFFQSKSHNLLYTVTLGDGFSERDFWKLGRDRILQEHHFSHTMKLFGPSWLYLYYWVFKPVEIEELGEVNAKVSNAA
jgi:hypothetical protein